MPGRVVGQQLRRVAGLDVLGEEQDPERRVLPAELDGRPEALVGEGRRHPDVDHRHVGADRRSTDGSERRRRRSPRR